MRRCTARRPSLADGPTSQLAVGRVLVRGLTVLFGSFVPFVFISALATALPFYYRWNNGSPIRSAATVLEVSIDIVFRGMCEALLVYAALQALSGRRVQPGVSVARAVRRGGPVLLTAILTVVSVAVGFVLLIVPALVATIALFVAIPACVMERLGPVRSLKRSYALTQGCGWEIFAVFCAIAIVGAPGHWLIGAFTPGTPAWLFPAVDFAWTTLINAYAAVLAAVIYYDLLVAKDRPGADRLAAAFG